MLSWGLSMWQWFARFTSVMMVLCWFHALSIHRHNVWCVFFRFRIPCPGWFPWRLQLGRPWKLWPSCLALREWIPWGWSAHWRRPLRLHGDLLPPQRPHLLWKWWVLMRELKERWAFSWHFSFFVVGESIANCIW